MINLQEFLQSSTAHGDDVWCTVFQERRLNLDRAEESSDVMRHVDKHLQWAWLSVDL